MYKCAFVLPFRTNFKNRRCAPLNPCCQGFTRLQVFKCKKLALSFFSASLDLFNGEKLWRQIMATIEQQIRSATDKLAKLKARELLAKQRQLARDKAAERRADAHRKIELGGLVIAADAADLNPAELVGALLTYLNSRTDERAEALRKRGLDHLEAREAARKARR